MVKMPWNRNRNRPVASNIPQEVEEYYQSAHKQSRGVAGLLTLATLILTLVIAVVLFFGGRWIVNKIANRNKTPDSSSLQINSPDSNKENNDNASQSLPNSDTSEEEQPTNNNAGNNQAIEAPRQTDNTSSNAPKNTPTTGPDSPEVPATQIPRTGPDGEE